MRTVINLYKKNSMKIPSKRNKENFQDSSKNIKKLKINNENITKFSLSNQNNNYFLKLPNNIIENILFYLSDNLKELRNFASTSQLFYSIYQYSEALWDKIGSLHYQEITRDLNINFSNLFPKCYNLIKSFKNHIKIDLYQYDSFTEFKHESKSVFVKLEDNENSFKIIDVIQISKIDGKYVFEFHNCKTINENDINDLLKIISDSRYFSNLKYKFQLYHISTNWLLNDLSKILFSNNLNKFDFDLNFVNPYYFSYL